MRSTITTPEFWAALIGQVIGLVVLFGGLTAQQGTDMTTALTTVTGGVLSVLTILGYIKAQATRKAVAIELLQLKASLLAASNDGAPAAYAQAGLIRDIDVLRASI